MTIHKAKDLLDSDSDHGASSTYISVHIPFTTQHKNTKVGIYIYILLIHEENSKEINIESISLNR